MALFRQAEKIIFRLTRSSLLWELHRQGENRKAKVRILPRSKCEVGVHLYMQPLLSKTKSSSNVVRHLCVLCGSERASLYTFCVFIKFGNALTMSSPFAIKH